MKIGSIIVFSGLMIAGLLMAGWVYAESEPETKGGKQCITDY